MVVLDPGHTINISLEPVGIYHFVSTRHKRSLMSVCTASVNSLWPMKQPEVHMIVLEVLQASIDRLFFLIGVVPSTSVPVPSANLTPLTLILQTENIRELGGNEDILAGHARLLDRIVDGMLSA